MESKVDVIVLDGQRYRAIKQTTLENDYFVMGQLKKTGIANITPNIGESAQDYAMRLMSAIIENGIPLKLLGGLLIPENLQDSEWTPEQAETTAAMIGKMQDKKDKEIVQSLIIAVVTDFFKEGLQYLSASPAASALENDTTLEQP